MERLGDILKHFIKTEHISDEPIKYCKFCGKPLYKVQLFRRDGNDWKPIGIPFIESCDCEEAQKERELRQLQEYLQREKANKIKTLLDYSGLGEIYLDKTFDNWNKKYNKAAYNAVFNYAKSWPKMSEQGKGLYIYGAYGTGKTHLVAALANYVIKKYLIRVIFGTITKLFMPLKDAIGLGDTYLLQRERERLYKVDLLIIDDLGKERPTDFVSEELYMLINTRYENKKPIVITSNYTLEEFADKYDKWTKDYGDKDLGSAMKSRLFEMCYYIKMDGPDYRLLKR